MDYKELLNKDFFILWINEIASTDGNPTIRSAAKEISQMVSDNYAVQSKSYYEPLYLKYKFKLYPTNTSFGANYLRNILYSYDGNVAKVVGLIQPMSSNAIAQTIISTPTPSEIDLSTYSNNEIVNYLRNIPPENNSKSIYSTQNHSTATYVRNVNCWAYGLRQQLTCFSPSVLVPELTETPTLPVNTLHGALVTPRHILFAAHNGHKKGSIIRFVTADNQVVLRTIIGVQSSKTEYINTMSDIGIAVLDSDVPSSITPCYVLPENYKDYLYDPKLPYHSYFNDFPTSFQTKSPIGIIDTNQDGKIFTYDLRGFRYNIDWYQRTQLTSYQPPFSNPEKEKFLRNISEGEGIRLGDSGSPIFILIDNKLVLIFMQGPASVVQEEMQNRYFISDLIPSLQERINLLNDLCGVQNSYKLNKIDLSKFTVTSKNSIGLYVPGDKGYNGIQPSEYNYPTPTPTPSVGTVEPLSFVAEQANKDVYDLIYTFKKTSKLLYKKIDHANGVYLRNEDSFVQPIVDKTTCVSVSNSEDLGQLVHKRCVLVTPRHVLMNPFKKIGVGSTIKFVQSDSVVVDRTLIDTKDISEIGGGIAGTNAVTVGLLDSDVPDTIKPCYFLPSNYKDYFNTYNPIFTGDPYSPNNEFWVNPQPACIFFPERSNNGVVVLQNLRSFWYNVVFFTYPQDASQKYPWTVGADYEAYYPTPYGNFAPDRKEAMSYIGNYRQDANRAVGSPAFLFLQNKLILLSFYIPETLSPNGTWFGASLSEDVSAMNTLISSIDSDNSISTGYTLNQISLSGYSLPIPITPTPTPSTSSM